MKSACIYCFTLFVTCSSLAFVKALSDSKTKNSDEVDDSRHVVRPHIFKTYHLHNRLRDWLRYWREHHKQPNQHQIHIPKWHPVNHLIKHPVHRPVTPRPNTDRKGPLNFPDFIARWQGEVESCGQQQVQPRLRGLRVVGGSTAAQGSWPWMVSFQYIPFKQHWCGGQLISNQWVLTAAHCLYAVPYAVADIANKWSVMLGRYNVSAPTEQTGQTFNIANLYVHPGFNLEKVLVPQAHPVPSNNDLALIKLDKPVRLNKWVSPICMPTHNTQPQNNQRCVISGWGATAKVGTHFKYPDLLQEAVVPVYNNLRCSRFPGYRPFITSNMVCAGYNSGKVDTCSADSGGPLQCKHGERWYSIGSTSWGDAGENGCAKAMRPGVYTKIANYIEWIHTTIFEDYIMGFDVESQ